MAILLFSLEIKLGKCWKNNKIMSSLCAPRLLFLRNLHTQVLFIFNAAPEAHHDKHHHRHPPSIPATRSINYDTHNFYLNSWRATKKNISPSLSSTYDDVGWLAVKRTAATKLYLFLIIKRYLYRIPFTICVLGRVKARVDAMAVKNIIVIFMPMLYITHIILLWTINLCVYAFRNFPVNMYAMMLCVFIQLFFLLLSARYYRGPRRKKVPFKRFLSPSPLSFYCRHHFPLLHWLPKQVRASTSSAWLSISDEAH